MDEEYVKLCRTYFKNIAKSDNFEQLLQENPNIINRIKELLKDEQSNANLFTNKNNTKKENLMKELLLKCYANRCSVENIQFKMTSVRDLYISANNAERQTGPTRLLALSRKGYCLLRGLFESDLSVGYKSFYKLSAKYPVVLFCPTTKIVKKANMTMKIIDTDPQLIGLLSCPYPLQLNGIPINPTPV